MSTGRRHAWAAYLAAMACALLAYRAGPSWMRSGFAFNVIGASSVVAIVVGTRRHLPGRRLAWYLFAVSLGVFVAGDVAAYSYRLFFGIDLPFPSLADAFYLAVYPAFIGGVMLLIHDRNPARDSASIIDALVVTIAAATASWIFLISPYVHDATLPLPTKLISVAYPLMDILAFGVVVRLAVGQGDRGPAFRMLVGGVVALLVTDSIYGWKLLHGGYESGGLLDLGWAVFYALAAAAALHPSMRRLSEPAPDRGFQMTRARLAMLAAASLGVPALMTIRGVSGDTRDVIVLAVASGFLFALVIARMGGLVLRHEAGERSANVLHAAGEGLVLATDHETVLSAALASAQSLVPSASMAGIYEIDAARRQIVSLRCTDTTAVVGAVTLHDISPGALAALATGETVAVPPPRTAATGGAFGVQATTLCPLIVRGRLWGVLLVTTHAPLKLSVEASLSTLAATVALAMEGVARADEAAQRRADARLSSLSRNASDVVCVVARDASVQYVSPSIERVLGYRADEQLGRILTRLIHPDDLARFASFVSTIAAHPTTRPTPVEFRMRHATEEWCTVEALGANLLDDENVSGLVLNIRDVSDRKIFESQLEHQAFHDALTGLPNRALFRNRVEHALARQRRGDSPVGVIFLDLDDFKTVNDSLGHAAGDQMLIQTAQRISAVARSADTPARLAGDEFAVLLDAPRDEVHALEVAERILAAIAHPLILEGRQVRISASVGIAFSGSDTHGAVGADNLLRNADVAMYQAKDQGKGVCEVFEPEMHAATLARLELKADLQRAVDAGEITLRYQPIMDLATDSISGFEALARWEHPSRGTVAPMDFIPLAEETGLIVPLGRDVLAQACRQAKILQDAHPLGSPLSMSVNLSARQLQRPEIGDEVRGAIAESGILAESLILELTESAMMEDIDVAILRLHELRALGVRLAIDDFGTGHSSLNYIRQFPVDILKIDKSFLWNSSNDEQVAAMTTAIVDLARILGLRSTAEGIEDAEQFSHLRSLGCDLGQGYHFSKPITGTEARALVVGGWAAAQPPAALLKATSLRAQSARLQARALS